MLGAGAVAPAGTVTFKVLPRVQSVGWWWKTKNWLLHRKKETLALAFYRGLASILGLVYVESALRLRMVHGDGRVTDYGVVSRRVVTTVGVAYIVDAFQNLVELEDMKYHGFGTGGSAEAVGNTALTTELTTEYVTNNTRPTGTTTEGATGNIYRTVATLSPDSGGTIAIIEHGIFNQASNAGGVMLDRSLFSAVNVVASADSLQATYELTFTAGS